MAPVCIVPFKPEHTEGVFSLILPIQQLEFGIPIDRAQQPDLADIPGFYQSGAGNFWVALADDTVVGSIGLLDIGNREAALRKMFVSSAYRGSVPGVAMQLLDTLLSWSRDRGVSDIYLGTTAAFLAAHRFYEKHGFRQVARNELPQAFPVMAVDSKFYTRAP